MIHDLLGGLQPPAPRDQLIREVLGHRSIYGACPLCGHGESSAEHLLVFCPAVEAAWRRIRTTGDQGRAPC